MEKERSRSNPTYGPDKKLLPEVARQVLSISRLRGRLGEHLGNRGSLDLTGYYKLYAAKKSIRIVYRIIDQEILVEVVAIGRREDLAAYQEALKRLKPGDRAKNT